MGRLCWLAGLAALGLPAMVCGAQEGQVVPSEPGTPYTLHVYEDLVQVPSLVLNSANGSYQGLLPQDFTIRLDSGPPFHPRHVRTQGDDSMSVAVLLDDSRGTDTHLVHRLHRAVPELPKDVFSPRDRLSVFVFDCNLERSTFNEPASEAVLDSGVSQALQAQGLHGPSEGPSCAHRLHLWDAMSLVAEQMHELPGRRVLLVISPGVDHRSRNSWEALRRYADSYSITIFGMRPAVLPQLMLPSYLRGRGPLVTEMEDPFGLLCGGTGGLLLDATGDTLAALLTRLMNLLRQRYILEFARPVNGTAGIHLVDVATSDKEAAVRTSGVTVPVKDRALLDDPSTVPSDPKRAPVVGDRKVMQH